MPEETIAVIEQADATGVPPQLSAVMRQQITAAENEARQEPRKAELAEQLHAILDSAATIMTDA